MAKLRIKLKQHTPIIQFQGEQDGAVLRATEFKPKLDKFIKKYAFNDEFDNYKEYLIGYKYGKDKEAFNYKVRFFVEEENYKKYSVPKNFPFYFNNIGSAAENDTNKFIFVNSIDVEFFSLNSKLIKEIEIWINKFLAVHNFGFRQNKGFGSFTSAEDNFDYLSLIKGLEPKSPLFYIKYDKRDAYKEMMEDAAIIYQLMKSGINYPREPKSYHKSYLFNYMKNRNIGNEKRFIKEEFFSINKDGMQKKYVRALLGLAEGVTFNSPAPKDKGRINIKYKSEIERFKSPILFKIIDKVLFIIPQCIEDEENYSIYNC